jgi:hypothetical protein
LNVRDDLTFKPGQVRQRRHQQKHQTDDFS